MTADERAALRQLVAMWREDATFSEARIGAWDAGRARAYRLAADAVAQVLGDETEDTP